MDSFDMPSYDYDARDRIKVLEEAHDELAEIVYELKEQMKHYIPYETYEDLLYEYTKLKLEMKNDH